MAELKAESLDGQRGVTEAHNGTVRSLGPGFILLFQRGRCKYELGGTTPLYKQSVECESTSAL